MSEFLQVIIALGVMVFGGGYLWGKFREGKNSSKFDTVKLFKEQIDALEGKVNLQDAEIKRLTGEVHELKLVIEAKDKRLGEVLAILQGRDPQMQMFMKELKDYIEAGKPAIHYITTEIPVILKRLEKFLDKQSF